MHFQTSPSRLAIRVATLVIMMSALGVEIAAAHGGHAHPEEGGLDPSVLFQAGGAALAVGAAYLVASAMYRRRDARKHGPDR